MGRACSRIWLGSSLAVVAAACALLVLGKPASALPSEYAGQELCEKCHAKGLEAYQHTIHAKVLNEQNGRTAQMRYGCEACHGPGMAHVQAGGVGGKGGPGWVTFNPNSGEDTSTQNAVCLQCHTGGQRLFWKGSPHQSRGAPCVSCHQVMHKASPDHLLARSGVVQTCAQCHVLRRSQTYRNAHMPVRSGMLLDEGWMDCTSCHNPHGTVTPKLLKANSPNDVCYSCHAEKRGPFLWEHAPVTENCMNCHDPHGSATTSMLKMAPPRLCQTCHVSQLHPSNPYPPTDRRVFGRACLNCHQNIHGSNHPSGNAFTR